MATLGEDGHVLVLKADDDYMILDEIEPNRFETNDFDELINYENDSYSLKGFIEEYDETVVIRDNTK